MVIMTIKLNDLAAANVLVATPGTFAAIAAYCVEYGQAEGPETVIATLAAAMSGGIKEFHSPVLPRGLRLNTATEVFEADLDAQRVRIESVPDAGTPDIIVSGHAGTREVLIERFPSSRVVEGNVSPDDIAGKVVAGTLPPHLVAETAAYIAAQITGFDYSKDGDLKGEELRERLVIRSAVRVTVE